MKLEIASYQAVKYSCFNFHYAKAMPMTLCSFSVFNDKGEWCGCIVYSSGANQHQGKKYGLVQGQVCELVRVALNGKQENTSKALSISLKLLQKMNPLLRLVVSYADCDQEHAGTIYQATNWIYEGLTELNGGTPKFKIRGKVIHGRSIAKKGWKQSIE
ncbi:protein Mom [Taibaiella lutea]|uniref:Protein Mom n=1 Tax=Taibaiella lutea TaxID=2608001 RepID=A0A5M6CBT8_9BACT|nr:protein Mom [Taibaiella lutea]KAA5532668.1 protein Mom [Taibaiella lutea]